MTVQPPSILSDYYTRDELAAELGRCWRTIKRWCDKGAGPPETRFGRTPYYKRTSVAAWKASREQGAGA